MLVSCALIITDIIEHHQYSKLSTPFNQNRCNIRYIMVLKQTISYSPLANTPNFVKHGESNYT